MTAEDVEKGGWWAADLPANQEWLCPECRKSSPVALWAEQDANGDGSVRINFLSLVKTKR